MRRRMPGHWGLCTWGLVRLTPKRRHGSVLQCTIRFLEPVFLGGVELFSALELSQVRDREQVLGLLIVPLFLDNVLEFTPVDKRAASLRRPGEQGVLLVVCTYAPNSSSE